LQFLFWFPRATSWGFKLGVSPRGLPFGVTLGRTLAVFIRVPPGTWSGFQAGNFPGGIPFGVTLGRTLAVSLKVPLRVFLNPGIKVDYMIMLLRLCIHYAGVRITSAVCIHSYLPPIFRCPDIPLWDCIKGING
jgi:hypothetical protein